MMSKAKETWSTVTMAFGLQAVLSAKLMPQLRAKSSASLTTPVSYGPLCPVALIEAMCITWAILQISLCPIIFLI